jgi:cysteine sulfinate desulfinase/cysteine desulfurase-like protein
MGLRAGTENVMLITALGKAAEVVHVELQDLHTHMQVGRIPFKNTKHMQVGSRRANPA